jgi:hypothetical protein
MYMSFRAHPFQIKNFGKLWASDWSPWTVPLKSGSFSCRKSKAELWDAERAPLIAARHAQNDPQRQIKSSWQRRFWKSSLVWGTAIYKNSHRWCCGKIPRRTISPTSRESQYSQCWHFQPAFVWYATYVYSNTIRWIVNLHGYQFRKTLPLFLSVIKFQAGLYSDTDYI